MERTTKETTELKPPKKETYEEKMKRKHLTITQIKQAIELVVSGKSIREAARMSLVPYATLRRYYLKQKNAANPEVKDSGPKNASTNTESCSKSLTPTPQLKGILKKPESKVVNRQHFSTNNLFNENQELKLATLFNGKNGNECRRIAYEMAVEWYLPYPKLWNDTKMADIQWMIDFQERLPKILDKQYKIKQNISTKEGPFQISNYSTTIHSNTLGNSHLRTWLNSEKNNSDSSELDSFGNESGGSNEFNILKPEENRGFYSSNKSLSAPNWDKGFMEIFSSNKKHNNSEPYKRRYDEQPDRSNSRLNQTARIKTESTKRDDTRNQSGPSCNSRRSSSDCFIDDTETGSLQIINDCDSDNDSDDNAMSQKSKKMKTEDTSIAKSNFAKMLKGVESIGKETMDADELFLLSLLPALKRIQEKDKLKAKIKLLEVLSNFEE